MRGMEPLTLWEACGRVRDPRTRTRQSSFGVQELLFGGMVSVILGARSYEEMALRVKERPAWFQERGVFPDGMPSWGTFRNVLMKLDAEELRQGLSVWMSGALRELAKVHAIAPPATSAQDATPSGGRPASAPRALMTVVSLAEGIGSSEDGEPIGASAFLDLLDAHALLVPDQEGGV